MKSQISNLKLQSRATLARWKFLLILPTIWILLALLGISYPGGELLTLGITLLPGIAIAKLLGYSDSGTITATSESFRYYLAVGAAPMFVAGLIFDLLRARVRTFLISWLIGQAIALSLLTYFFFAEAMRSSLTRASNLFDLDQPARVIALFIGCIAIGFYLSIPFTILAALLHRPRPSSPERTTQE